MTWFKSVNANIEPEDIGAVSSTLVSDSYSSSKTYAVGEYCIYNDTLWKCLVACTGKTPTKGTYWTQVSIISELIALRQAISQGGGGMKALNYASTKKIDTTEYTTTKDGVLVTGYYSTYKNTLPETSSTSSGPIHYYIPTYKIYINDNYNQIGTGAVLPIKAGTTLKAYDGYSVYGRFIPYKD